MKRELFAQQAIEAPQRFERASQQTEEDAPQNPANRLKDGLVHNVLLMVGSFGYFRKYLSKGPVVQGR